MPDLPIAYTPEGRPLYDNTPTVVAVAVVTSRGLLAMRRAGDIGYGKIGLPGGYHMRCESWQDGGAREVLEETGWSIDPSQLTARHVITDPYGNNMIFARYEGTAWQTDAPLDGEALEVLFLQEEDMLAEDWAFPLHFAFGLRALEERKIFDGMRMKLDTLPDRGDGLGLDHRLLAMRLAAKLMEVDPDWRESITGSLPMREITAREPEDVDV